MPLGRNYYRRRRRPRRRKTTTRRVRRVRRPRKKRHPRRAIVSLPKQILPRRGFAVHTCIRYIRIPQRLANTTPPTPVVANWEMPNWGSPPVGEELPFNTLFISCNDPMSPFNEAGSDQLGPTPNYPAPDTPAFLTEIDGAGSRTKVSQALFDTSPVSGGGVPPTGTFTGYRNLYGSFWQKMRAFYEKYTVVGSTATVSFYPDSVYSVDYARREAKHCMFTMGVVPTRGAAPLESASQAQAFTEQPGFITREYHSRSQNYGKSAALVMTRKWSAKRNMGLNKGNIVGNNAITGDGVAPYSQTLTGIDAPNQWSATSIGTQQEVTKDFSLHPAQQNWFAWSGNSLLSNNTTPGAYEKAEWPSGLIKIKVKYATVWSDPRFINNEII